MGCMSRRPIHTHVPVMVPVQCAVALARGVPPARLRYQSATEPEAAPSGSSRARAVGCASAFLSLGRKRFSPSRLPLAADLLCGVKPRGESPRWLFASFRWLLSPRLVPLRAVRFFSDVCRGALGSPLTGFAFGAMRSVHRKAGSARRTRGLLREVYSSIFNRLPGYSYRREIG